MLHPVQTCEISMQAIALASLTNFGSNFVVSLLLPTLRETAGPAGGSSGFVFEKQYMWSSGLLSYMQQPTLLLLPLELLP